MKSDIFKYCVCACDVNMNCCFWQYDDEEGEEEEVSSFLAFPTVLLHDSLYSVDNEAIFY